MKVELEIVKDSFVNDRGERIDYYRCEAVILGEVIRFNPRQEDKKLLAHLLKSCENMAV